MLIWLRTTSALLTRGPAAVRGTLAMFLTTAPAQEALKSHTHALRNATPPWQRSWDCVEYALCSVSVIDSQKGLH